MKLNVQFKRKGALTQMPGTDVLYGLLKDRKVEWEKWEGFGTQHIRLSHHDGAAHCRETRLSLFPEVLHTNIRDEVGSQHSTCPQSITH